MKQVAILTGLQWEDEPQSPLVDRHHWEEELFGDYHPFTLFVHNKIRYGFLLWGPIGWATVTWRRGRFLALKSVPLRKWVIPRCDKCDGFLPPWVIVERTEEKYLCKYCSPQLRRDLRPDSMYDIIRN